MKLPNAPRKKQILRKNLVAIDGTLERVERIRVSVQENGKDASPYEYRVQHNDAVREHLDCNNRLCFNGGISLGDLLREMVKSRQEEFVGTSFCTGQEGDPEEPGPHPSCATRYLIQINLDYR